MTLFLQGKYDETIKAYDVAIRLDPNHVAAWHIKVQLSVTRANTKKPLKPLTKLSA